MTSTSPLPPQQLLDDVTETASCPICSQLFDDPRLLPCSHTFCLGCIGRYVARQNRVFQQQVVLPPRPRLPCPLCRHEFDVPADGLDRLPKNFIVDELTQKLRKAELSPKEATQTSSGFPALDSPAFTRLTQSEADLQLAIQLAEEENNFVPSTSDDNEDEIARDAMIAWALTAEGVQEERQRKRMRTAAAAATKRYGSQGAAAAAGALFSGAQQVQASTHTTHTATASVVVIQQPRNNNNLTNVTAAGAGATTTNTEAGCCRCCCCCCCCCRD